MQLYYLVDLPAAVDGGLGHRAGDVADDWKGSLVICTNIQSIRNEFTRLGGDAVDGLAHRDNRLAANNYKMALLSVFLWGITVTFAAFIPYQARGMRERARARRMRRQVPGRARGRRRQVPGRARRKRRQVPGRARRKRRRARGRPGRGPARGRLGRDFFLKK